MLNFTQEPGKYTASPAFCKKLPPNHHLTYRQQTTIADPSFISAEEWGDHMAIHLIHACSFSCGTEDVLF